MITLALITGLRRGDLLGLEWHHIDWETGVISVEQSVTLSPGGEAHVKEPKTKGSRRKVAIPPAMLKELQEYCAYKINEFEKIGDRWQGNGRYFVFNHPYGKYLHQKKPYLWFRDFLKKRGLRIFDFTICGILQLRF